MKLPRDVAGRTLVAALGQFGYQVSRQKGSHIRLTTDRNGEHHVTVPDHDALRVGTLSGILNDVSTHLGMTRDALASALFGS